MGYCGELPEGAGSKCAEKCQQTGCGQAAGHQAAGAAGVEVAALLTSGLQQWVRGAGELCGKAMFHSSKHWETLRA